MLKPLELPPLPQRPLVSVVTAAYNAEPFIAEAVASVLGQRYGEVEHVVVDDGSTDSTGQVVADLARDDPRVRHLTRPNGGQTAAFNTAADHVGGQVVLFLDADDRFHPDKAEEAVAAFRRSPRAGMLNHKLQEVDSEGRALSLYPPLSSLPEGWFGEQLLAEGGLLVGVQATTGLGLRREVFDAIFPLPLGERTADVVIGGLAPLVTELVAIDEPLADYRWHGDNLTFVRGLDAGEIDRRLDAQRSVWEHQRSFLAARDPDAAERLAPLERNRFVAELSYTRSRLVGAGDARRRHRDLTSAPGFAAQPRLRRAFWQLAPLLPRPVFTRVMSELSHAGAARRALATVARPRGAARSTSAVGEAS